MIALLAQQENRVAFELLMTLGGAFALFVAVPLMALWLLAR